ncbi:MAG: hypothetical protein WC280_02895 [Patescibacteria group bacterium]
MVFKKILISAFLLLTPVCFSMAYSFSDNSGLNSFAEKTGHSEQKLFSSGEGIASSIGIIIQYLLSFLGVIFMVLMVYGGILWMTASGNDQQVEKAKKIIVESILGLVIIVSAYAISILVINAFNFQ